MTNTNESQIVWELKEDKVVIRDQADRTALGLKIEFSANTEGFRGTLQEYRVARYESDDMAGWQYLDDVIEAIRQAREAWQRANGMFTERKSVQRSRPAGETPWGWNTANGYGVAGPF